MNHIDKEIFKQSGVSKRLRHLSIWYWVVAALGIICTILTITLNNISGGLSALLLLGLVIGDFSLMIAICYYLFGDSRGAYQKECGQFLNREFDYYPRSVKQSLLSAFESQDIVAINNIKKGVVPEISIIRYVNDARTVTYAQLMEVQSSKELPLTDIVKISNQ